MKKILLALTVVFSLPVFAQSITVNTDTHTVPQLVNDVLINSSCVQGTNISSSTGSNFGSVNGIGYFENTNPNFPMSSGVILSTGNALNAPGPNNNLLSEGSTSWPGDTSLESTMAEAGIPMVSTNATVLEFDFTPISSQFSFDFVFASEEYGNYQCQFSDAFAFLLTNENTGITTNLAVVPGTNLPISVVTIRDFLYNSSCPSENAEYFGSYNGGSAALGSATNFNGQTVMMNASAVLVPNTPYHIKLVIADRTDFQSDSAIFLGTNSFNIGQNVLGPDLTVASHTAICKGGSYTLDTGLDPAVYTFSWTKNGTPIADATGPSLLITQSGTYGVSFDDTTDPCPALADSIVVQYYPEIVAATPNTLYKCDTGAAAYDYDLSQNTPVVSAGISPAPLVSYYTSQYNAENDIDALPSVYNSPSGATIYVRIKKASTGCAIVKSFLLSVSPPPVANTPPDLTKCEKSLTVHNANFTLTTQNAAVLNGQSNADYPVSYYSSLANAQSATSPLPSAYNNVVDNTVVYVRVQNGTDTSCYSVTSFTIHVNPLPPVDVLSDVIVCESFTLPALVNGNYFTGNNGTGTALFAGDVITTTQVIYIYNQPDGPPNCANVSHFKVTIVDPATMTPHNSAHCGSYALPGLQYGGYFTQPGGQGDAIPAGTVISSTQTVYYYFMSVTVPVCIVDSSFIVTILPEPAVAENPDVFKCTSYTLPALSVGHYYTGPGGTGTELPAGTVLTASQKVYVYAETGTTPNCTAEDSFNVVIGFTPPADVVQCSPYTIPALESGGYFTAPGGGGSPLPAGSVISTSQMVYVFVPGDNDCVIDLSVHITILQPPVDTIANQVVCTSYTLPTLLNGAYFTEAHGGGTAMQPGDVISADQTIYIFNTLGDCSNESHFTVTINPLPAIDSRASIDICNGTYTLTPLAVGNYYTLPGGQGTQLAAGDVITTSQTIYVYAQTASQPICSVENSFVISILNIEADSPAPVTTCDSYTLQPLTVGNYFTLSGGAATAGNVMMHAGDVLTTSKLLYIYTESGERSNCFDENTFQVTINHTPDLAAITDVFACNSYTLPVLTAGDYYTGPGKTGTHMNAGDVLTANQMLYVYAETNTVPNCSVEKSFNATIFNVAQLPDVTTCDAFSLPALAAGNYYTGSLGTGTQLPAGSVITSSQTIYVYAPSPFTPTCYDETSFNVVINHTPNLSFVSDAHSCSSFTLAALPVGEYYTGPGKTGTQLHAGDVITADQTIYVYAETGTTPNCFSEQSFHISIFKVAELPDVTTCEGYNLPAIPAGQFYTGPGGTGTHLPMGSYLNTSLTIYVYAQSPFTPTCYDETSFNLTIINAPVAFPVPASETTVCDEDGTNNGMTSFDLTQLDGTILGTQTGAEYEVTYYANQADATLGTNPITETAQAAAYARVVNSLAPNCFDTRLVTINVKKLPAPTPIGGTLCYDPETQTVVNPYTIYSGLSSSGYTFEWKNEAGEVVGTANSYTAEAAGVYTVVATSNATGCSSAPIPVTVVQSQPALVSYATSNDFSDSMSITVTAEGSGQYQYSLDGGNFQDSPVFENVASGEHTIVVRDLNGCAEVTIKAMVLNYPHYFTPNGDGIHDTWNITDLRDQPDSKIFIFDRYGKLITEIKPDQPGWDGTMNGHQLPSTDYWFTVNYLDEGTGTEKEFRAHFAMKR